jgi:hypothetical protein
MAHWVELRVHGVSGTPPEAMLGAPVVVQVAGDSLGRFLRPATGAGEPLGPDGGDRVLEAYHWGLFTSGSFTQGLWFLLLPFGMVNAAAFMLPPGRGWACTGARAVLRLTGLAMTAVLVTGTVHVLVEALAWNGPGGGAWWALSLAVLGCLVVLATVTLLGRGRIGAPPPGQSGSISAPDGPRVPPTGLADAAFYQREPDAPLLRRLHVAVGLLVVALPFAALYGQVASPVLTWVVGVLLGATAVAGTLLGDSRAAVHRLVPMPEDAVARERLPVAGRWDPMTWSLVLAAGGILGVSVVLALMDLPEPAGLLPGLAALGRGLVLLGTAALVALAVLVEVAARAAGRDRAAARGADATPRPFLPYAGGRIAWVVAALGMFVGLGFAVGIGYAASWLLARSGQHVPMPEISMRVAYSWGIAGLVGVGVLAWAVVDRLRTRRTIEARVTAAYAPVVDGEVDQARLLDPAAGGTWTGRLKYVVPRVGAVYAAIGAVLCLGVVFEILPWEGADWLVGLGTLLVVGLAVGLVLAGRGAVLRADARRTVNVVWDVIAFWPREAHPFVPPPYSQRAVRDLADRITWHLSREGGAERVLVAAHSQGSLIAVAALLRVPRRHHSRIALVTHGSQLQYAYARAFPGYVSPPLLRWVLRTLDDRWINLFRDTDPVGGPVLSWDRSPETAAGPWRSTRLTADGVDAAAVDVVDVHGVRRCGREWRLLDPAVVDPERRPWPGRRGHSDMPRDEAWPDAVAAAWAGATAPSDLGLAG